MRRGNLADSRRKKAGGNHDGSGEPAADLLAVARQKRDDKTDAERGHSRRHAVGADPLNTVAGIRTERGTGGSEIRVTHFSPLSTSQEVEHIERHAQEEATHKRSGD